MLSEKQLRSMRATVNQALPQTAVVLSSSQARDAVNTLTTTWTPGESYACLVLSANSPEERREGGKPQSVTLWNVRLPYDTPVTVRHRLRIDGADYEILATDHGKSYKTALDCTCRRLD